MSKPKAFEDGIFDMIHFMEIVFHRVENIVGKRENASYQHVLYSQHRFQKSPLFFSSCKGYIVKISIIMYNFEDNFLILRR